MLHNEKTPIWAFFLFMSKFFREIVLIFAAKKCKTNVPTYEKTDSYFVGADICGQPNAP